MDVETPIKSNLSLAYWVYFFWIVLGISTATTCSTQGELLLQPTLPSYECDMSFCRLYTLLCIHTTTSSDKETTFCNSASPSVTVWSLTITLDHLVVQYLPFISILLVSKWTFCTQFHFWWEQPTQPWSLSLTGENVPCIWIKEASQMNKCFEKNKSFSATCKWAKNCNKQSLWLKCFKQKMSRTEDWAVFIRGVWEQNI